MINTIHHAALVSRIQRANLGNSSATSDTMLVTESIIIKLFSIIAKISATIRGCIFKYCTKQFMVKSLRQGNDCEGADVIT